MVIFVFEEKTYDYRKFIVFFNMFLVYSKTQRRRLQIPPVSKAFIEKLTSSDGLVLTEGLNVKTDKAAFSNYSGLYRGRGLTSWRDIKR